LYEHLDHVMPELQKSRAALAYAPVLLVALPGTPAAVMLLILVGAAFGANVINTITTSRLAIRGGRIVLAAATAVSIGVVGARAAEILG
jgi:hypothetical protein